MMPVGIISELTHDTTKCGAKVFFHKTMNMVYFHFLVNKIFQAVLSCEGGIRWWCNGQAVLVPPLSRTP